MTTKAFYLIDKPNGYTSFDVLRDLRKKLNIKKMGHTGTLDPLATGVLLVAVGNYTKLIPYFEKDVKEYTCTISLDGITPSYDCETEVDYISKEKQKHFKENLKREDIEQLIREKFTGEITQIPPKYSALKIGGRKALDIVRSGGDVEMKTRKATIYEAELLNYDYPLLECRFSVSAGTYIRSIGFDIGDLLGTGGYLTQLRRTKVGKLDINNTQKLDDFDSEKYLDIYDLFGKEKFIELEDNIVDRMNIGLETIYPTFEGKDGEYFVEREAEVTNIVSYTRPMLKPKKHII